MQVVKRIAGGYGTNHPGITMNYAPAFPLTTTWKYEELKDGRILEDDPPEQWLYEVTLGWDFDEVWVMSNVDGCPKLRGVDTY
jgi:hypothetical protein